MAQKPKGKLKVRVVIEVEVDRDAYDAEYGEDASAAEVRDFVKGTAVDAVNTGWTHLGHVIEVVG